MTCFSSLFSFLLLLTDVFAASIDIPIYRRVAAVNGRMRARDVARAADALGARYGYPIASSREQKRQSSDVPITNQDGDSSYFVAATFGTPPQSLNVILGFATADTWVATPQCGNCSSTTPRFNSSKSSTYTTAPGSPQIIIQYTESNVSGVQSMDQVGMGQFIVPNQTFIAVNYTTPGFLTGSVSGVFGLAFASISTTNTNTFFQTLLSSNQLAASMMSFYLTRLKGTVAVQAEAPGGVFTLGGSNPAYYKGTIDYQNFPAGVNPSYWMLPVTGVLLDGVSKLTTPGMAALDVSANVIGGPSADVANFWAAVPGSIALTGINAGVYSFPCSTQINASMTFGGQVWPIDPADLNLGPAPGGGCVGGIVVFLGSTSPGNPTWILGSAFLKNVYTVLRASPLSIGFAEVADVPGRNPNSPLPPVPDKVGGNPFGANNGTSSGTSDRFGSSFLLVISLVAFVSVTVIGL